MSRAASSASGGTSALGHRGATVRIGCQRGGEQTFCTTRRSAGLTGLGPNTLRSLGLL